ncbi:MAG TPA: xanthine dehydrogenase family protein subunit M [Gaiellaceae bacterium]
MKPPPFEYYDPESVGEALALVAELGDDAKVLAGGQSLVPLLNFRLARPAALVDLNRIGELDTIAADGRSIRIGAMTRQATLERSREVAARIPLLTECVRFIGHTQIRNRGTVGGSVAHADPAAELPLVLTTLEARFELVSASGRRSLTGEELFVTHLTTAIAPDELLVRIDVDVPPTGTGWAFEEFARRHGDFALGGAAVLLRFDAGGAVETVRIGMLAAADTPLRAHGAEQALQGAKVDEATAEEAAELAVADVAPTGDIHGGTEYRRGLLRAMVRRALLAASVRARGGR